MKNLRYNEKEGHFEWQDEELDITCCGILDLMVIKKALDNPRVFKKIWALQDGYPGVPPQGYDWSGIRDSSPEAIGRMVLAAIKGDRTARELYSRLVIMKNGEFAGKTPTGSKIHHCHRTDGSACWDYVSNRSTHFTKVTGKVNHNDLCRKCWGIDPEPAFLANFGLELK